MSERPGLTTCSRASIATIASVVFFCSLVLSAAPQLHTRIHPDANRADHSCAVTLVVSGSYDHATHRPLVSAPAPLIHLSKIPALTPEWVESPFLGARIFEHAPPVA